MESTSSKAEKAHRLPVTTSMLWSSGEHAHWRDFDWILGRRQRVNSTTLVQTEYPKSVQIVSGGVQLLAKNLGGREKWNEQFLHHGNGTRYIMLEFHFGSCAEPPMAKLNQTSTVEMAATNVLAQRLHSQTGPAEFVRASAITDAAFALVFTLPPPTRPAGNRRRTGAGTKHPET